MNKKQIQKLFIDASLILILSISVVLIGMVTGTLKRNLREQNSYLSFFKEVLPASKYEKVNSDILRNYPEINSVYKASDDSNLALGYILDITYSSFKGNGIHSLVAVSSDGSQLIGYKLIEDGLYSNVYSENEIKILQDQSMRKAMPICVNIEEEEIVVDDDNPVISITGLHDGIYYAQSFTADKAGFIDYVEIEISGGIITRVKWDAFNVDRTTKDRSEASLTGAYTISGENWATQSYYICHALIDCQDPQRLAMKSDGTTDIIPGVTCNIRRFVELSEECLKNSRHGFNEEMYIETMMDILDSSYSGFRDVCVLTEDGYIVYSFKDMSPLISNDGYYETIYEAFVGVDLNEDNLEDDIDDGIEVTLTPVPTEPSYYVVGEDGVVRDQQNPILTMSVDGIALSEFKTFIDGIPSEMNKSNDYCSSINIAYKFLKEYFNWMS